MQSLHWTAFQTRKADVETDRHRAWEGPSMALHNRCLHEPQRSSSQAWTYDWRLVHTLGEIYLLVGQCKPDSVASWDSWMRQNRPCSTTVEHVEALCSNTSEVGYAYFISTSTMSGNRRSKGFALNDRTAFLSATVSAGRGSEPIRCTHKATART
jgi:hypothetical protein